MIDRRATSDSDDESAANPSPSGTPIEEIPYAAAAPDLVTLARMCSMEAELACVKLRSRGVPCFIADQNISIADPLVIPNTRLQVRSGDLERAAAILSEPAEVGTGAEYADEAWRCSKCHRKTVELKPMSPRLKRIIMAFVGLALLPVPAGILRRFALIPETVERQMGVLGLLWFLVVIVLGVVMVFNRRHKQCTTCGHEW